MTERTLIRISGPDRVNFLQNLITNDVTRAESGLIYAALLTPQGKFIADFFVFSKGESLVLDVAPEAAPGLIQKLTMYKLRADVVIEGESRAVTQGTGPVPSGAFTDPRHPALGWRDYSGATTKDHTDWQMMRVAHVIPETGAELTPDSYILEMGFERLNGVDFKKGCYVGQEVTARMKHKTELRKGLGRVCIPSDIPSGTPIETADGKPVGHITTACAVSGLALAYLRFDRLDAPLRAAGKEVRVDWLPGDEHV